jgi:hypothetical protein
MVSTLNILGISSMIFFTRVAVTYSWLYAAPFRVCGCRAGSVAKQLSLPLGTANIRIRVRSKQVQIITE